MFFTGRTASIMCGKMLEVSVIDGSCWVRWVLGGKGEINVAIFLSLATLFGFRPFPLTHFFLVSLYCYSEWNLIHLTDRKCSSWNANLSMQHARMSHPCENANTAQQCLINMSKTCSDTQKCSFACKYPCRVLNFWNQEPKSPLGFFFQFV